MNNNKNKRRGVPVFLGVAAVWFGTHAGPGAASGRQMSEFFGTYGKAGLFFSFLSMFVLGLCVFIALDFARMKKVYDFKGWANAFYHPYEKVFSTIYELIFVMTVIVAVSTCVAVGAQAMQDYIGLPYLLSAGILVVITIFMTMYGANLLRNVSTILTIIIIVCLTTVIIFGFMSPQADLAGSLKAMPIDYSILGKGLLAAIMYAGVQTTGIISSTVSVSDGLKTRKDVFLTTVIGVLVDYILIAAIILLMFAYPSSLPKPLPIYEILESLNGGKIMLAMYVVVLELAIISTLAGFCFAVTTRYSKFIPLSSKRVRDLSATSITMAICLGFAQFGVVALVKQGYGYIGYVGIALVILPILVFGPSKLRKAAKELN